MQGRVHAVGQSKEGGISPPESLGWGQDLEWQSPQARYRLLWRAREMHVDEVGKQLIAEAVDRTDPAGEVSTPYAGVGVNLHPLADAKPGAGTGYDLGTLPLRALEPCLRCFKRIRLTPPPRAEKLRWLWR